jgi:hypothetical protein
LALGTTDDGVEQLCDLLGWKVTYPPALSRVFSLNNLSNRPSMPDFKR